MRVSVGVWVLICTLTATTALAQSASGGAIRGYVKDGQDAVLPGVRLTATSPDASGALAATSDQSGYYRLLDLPPGDYTLTAELDGFAKWVRAGVTIRAGLNLNLLIVMSVGAVEQRVDVTMDVPLVERHVAEQAVNISGELQRAVPLSTSN